MRSLLFVAVCVSGVFGQDVPPDPSSHIPESSYPYGPHKGPDPPLTPNINQFPQYDLTEDIRFIKNMEKKNQQLRVKTDDLKKRCNSNYERFVDIYNKLLERLHQAEYSEEIERNITVVFEADGRLDLAIEEINRYLRIFQLKMIILKEDVLVLKSRSHLGYYEICKTYSSYIKFQPEEESAVDTRSLSKSVTITETRKQIAKLQYEKKKALLDIKKEQAVFQNHEQREFTMYYAGHCKRKLDTIKKLISDLKRFPEGSGNSSQLTVQYNTLKRGVARKHGRVQVLLRKLRKVHLTIKELQNQYDRLTNAARCFHKLDEWHISTVMEEIEEIVYSSGTAGISETFPRHTGLNDGSPINDVHDGLNSEEGSENIEDLNNPESTTNKPE